MEKVFSRCTRLRAHYRYCQFEKAQLLAQRQKRPWGLSVKQGTGNRGTEQGTEQGTERGTRKPGT